MAIVPSRLAAHLRQLLRSEPPPVRERALLSGGCAVLYAAFSLIAPPFGELVQLDSYGYINFAAIRTAFYPIILRVLTAAGLSLEQITIVQLLALTLALAFLLDTLLRAGLSRLLTVLFALGMATNVFFTSFYGTIMTEAFFISVMMFASAWWIDYLRTGRAVFLALAGLCVGIATGIRPSGAIFLPMLMISAWLKFHRRDASIPIFLACLIGPVAAPIAAEITLYHVEHGPKRSSVLHQALFSKAALLARPDAKFVGPHAPALAELNKRLSATYQPVHAFVAGAPSSLARLQLTIGFEWISFASAMQDIAEVASQHGVPPDDLVVELTAQMARSDITGYLRLVLLDYVGSWCITLARFPPVAAPLSAYLDNAPRIPLESPGLPIPRPKPSAHGYVVFPAFMGAGGVTLLLATFIVIFIVRPRLGDRTAGQDAMIAAFFAASVHAAIGFNSLINNATSRYLIAAYPQILLALMFAVQAASERFGSRRETDLRSR
jgi:hypothetical protein